MVRRDLTTQERNRVVQFILEACIDGNPPRGKRLEAQQKFGISRQTVSRIWSAAKQQQEEGKPIHLVSGKITTTRKKVIVLDLNLLKSLHYTKRGSIRLVATGLGKSKTTVGRWVQKGDIKAHTSAIKPALTGPNMLLRLKFSLDALEIDSTFNKLMFKNMHNTVHIDEKWFYITKGKHRFYLAPGEEEPHRTCKSKKFISKIMFMCAVSRPIFSENGDVVFDGKIGIFPFTQQVPAKRNSKNRPVGTMETKPIESVTKAVIKECLINKILPAIRSKWPEGVSKVIHIQQDNAKPHILDNDPDFRVAANQDGFHMILVQQPPNSPDTNVNDLGWFTSIQALQVQTACKSMEELLNAVVTSFENLSPMTLNNVFLSLQGCMIEIMKLRGQNCYKVPHLGKEALARSGQLPLNLEVPLELAIQCIEYLKDMGCMEGMERITNALGMESVEGL